MEPLSKADIVDFYNHYIRPQSPSRAKLAIHLHAQSSAADLLLAEGSDSEKPTLIALLEQFLASCEIDVDEDKLQKRFDGMDLAQSDPETMLEALQQYLKTDLKLDQEQAAPIIEHGTSLMQKIMPKSNLGELTSSSNDAAEKGNGQEEKPTRDHAEGSTIIDDVRAFKANLLVTAGPRPVKPLSDFEESSPKL